MTAPLADHALDTLFRAARTRYAWTEEKVPETLIRAVYDLAKWGSTSANCSPARFVFIGSAAGKEKLKPFLERGNVEKAMTAPWTVIIATDMKFFDQMPKLFPHNPGAREWFTGEGKAFDAGFRNATLQAAYLMMAARSLGLDCGPMSGFDKAGVDQAFFADNPETATWQSNFLCNLGHGTDQGVHDRLPRLSFEDACRIL
jgi:3-hydroxypropanoate dehydrogenase